MFELNDLFANFKSKGKKGIVATVLNQTKVIKMTNLNLLNEKNKQTYFNFVFMFKSKVLSWCEMI